ncbi:hypothetical protein HY734_00590 [Candidatus Uhrbacteria bacterium]|nr:hypothetical protein [Candidatus Uhrbacteria bacterium]
MPQKDNQTDLASHLAQPKPAPAKPSSGNDGMVVTTPTGQRIELGQKPSQTKSLHNKRA